MAGELEGRNIVITGGTGALGRAVVARLLAAGAGCHLPGHRRGPEGLDAPEGRLSFTPGVDLRDQAAVERYYGALPPLWASVHLAGGFAMAPVAETGAAEFLAMLQMNALTAFLAARAAVAAMRRAGGGGRIVNVAARPGLDPRRGARAIAYTASKAAVAALTVALAEEVKAEGILVNAIAPSTLDSPANRAAMPRADPAKWLTPEAAAETVAHLVSPLNREINGALIPLYARG